MESIRGREKDADSKKVILYPYHFLPPYIENNNLPTTTTSQIAGALLYFDSIYITNYALPGEISFPDHKRSYKTFEELRSKWGKEAIRNWRKSEQLPLKDRFFLEYLDFLVRENRFRTEYQALLQDGVIEYFSLSQITQDASGSARRAGNEEAANVLNMNSVLAGFAAWQKNSKLFSESENVKAFQDSFRDARYHLGLSCQYTIYLLEQDNTSESRNLLERAGQRRDFLELYWSAFLLDTFHQATSSSILNVPFLSFDPSHLTAFGMVGESLSGRSDEKGFNSHLLGSAIFGSVLSQLPEVIPRSPEDILILREKCRDELSVFRQAVRNLANDIVHDSEKIPSPDLVARKADKHILRPLRDLHRKLSSSNKALVANLFSGSTFLSAMVGFLISSDAFSGLSGASIGLFIAAIRTELDRRKEISQSEFAFLIRAARK